MFWFLRVIGFILICICIDSFFGLSTGGDHRTDPAFIHHTVTWAVGSTPEQMCAGHGGVAQVMPSGYTAPNHELPQYSEVACSDGAVESVS